MTQPAGYKCPRSVDFLDELPKSGAGKILKRDLRDRYWTAGARHPVITRNASLLSASSDDDC